MHWMRRTTVMMLATTFTFASFAACHKPVVTCESNITGELAKVTDKLEELAKDDRSASADDGVLHTIREWFRSADDGEESTSEIIRRWLKPEPEGEDNDA